MTDEREIAKLQESLRLARAELARANEQLEALLEDKAAAEAAAQHIDPVAPPRWRARVKRLLRRLDAGTGS